VNYCIPFDNRDACLDLFDSLSDVLIKFDRHKMIAYNCNWTENSNAYRHERVGITMTKMLFGFNQQQMVVSCLAPTTGNVEAIIVMSGNWQPPHLNPRHPSFSEHGRKLWKTRAGQSWAVSTATVDSGFCRRLKQRHDLMTSPPFDKVSSNSGYQQLPTDHTRHVIVWKRKKTSVTRRKAKDGVTDKVIASTDQNV